jgi:hypothetical protein
MACKVQIVIADNMNEIEVMFVQCTGIERGTRCRSWLRHYATSQKVAGLIPVDVIGIFN